MSHLLARGPLRPLDGVLGPVALASYHHCRVSLLTILDITAIKERKTYH